MATGMKTGVGTSPRRVWSTPARARPSVRSSVNRKVLTARPAPCPRHDGDARAAAVRVPGPDAALADLLPPVPTSDPDVLLGAFLTWVQTTGLTLYPAQEEALLELMAGKHVLLATPTGSGKSLVAVALHFKALARGEDLLLHVPIKALVNEKFFALCELFGAEHVGMLTGDASINRGRADRLLHGRGPGKSRPAGGGAARRRGGDGRVPLLRGPGARQSPGRSRSSPCRGQPSS